MANMNNTISLDQGIDWIGLLSVISTFLAVVVALFMGLKRKKPKIRITALNQYNEIRVAETDRFIKRNLIGIKITVSNIGDIPYSPRYIIIEHKKKRERKKVYYHIKYGDQSTIDIGSFRDSLIIDKEIGTIQNWKNMKILNTAGEKTRVPQKTFKNMVNSYTEAKAIEEKEKAKEQ